MVLHDFKYGSLESLLNNLGEKTVRSGQCTLAEWRWALSGRFFLYLLVYE